MKKPFITLEKHGYYVTHEKGVGYTVFIPSTSGLFAVSERIYRDTEQGQAQAEAWCNYLAAIKRGLDKIQINS